MEKEKNVIIDIGGKTYALYKISNLGIKVLEKEISIPISKLLFLASRKFGYDNSDLWAVIWACVYVETPMTYDEFLKETDKAGISAETLNVMGLDILTNSFITEKEQKKKKGVSNSKN